MENISLKEEKRQLRGEMRDEMTRMSSACLAASDEALCRAFLALPQLAVARRVLIYDGVGTEVHTRTLFFALQARGIELCYPLCLPAWQMQARHVEHLDDLVPDIHQIPAPRAQCPVVAKNKLDLILVPALCCDKQGYRLGQGGGYYDRYLEDYKGFTVAFCRAALLQEKLPSQGFDAPMDLVLTEKDHFARTIRA